MNSVAFKSVRENDATRNKLREACNNILNELDVLDSLTVTERQLAAAHDIAICNSINTIVQLAERY